MIVHLNGWPGVGKQTIGGALAAKLGARLIPNHLLHDVAIVCAGFNGPLRWTLYESVRVAAYAALAQLPVSDVFVMTNALCSATPREDVAWRHVVDLAMTRNVPLVPVVLSASLDENMRRVQSPSRVGRKLADADALKLMTERSSIQRPDVSERIDLDVTDLTMEQAADTIIARLGSLKPRLRPASLGHLRMANA